MRNTNSLLSDGIFQGKTDYYCFCFKIHELVKFEKPDT